MIGSLAQPERKEMAYAGATRSILGRRLDMMSSLVPTTSLGILLTRYAPLRTAILPAADMPERLERMEPASDALEPGSRKRGGGAKSSAVKVPDLRRACLITVSALLLRT